MKIHEIAQAGFTRGAAAYERGRPGYPAAAIAFMAEQLGLNASATVVDIGAGTGKLARLLIRTGARIVAVEPVAAMREQFSHVLPDTPILDGTAEALPLADSYADAATAAQAFHWFANAQALAEIHRVLKPHGRLGLIWNNRDAASSGWMREVWALIERGEGNLPRYRKGNWKNAFAEYAGFRPVIEKSFEHAQRGDFAMVSDRIASLSFVANMDDANRLRLLENVHGLLERHPETRGKEIIEIPYRTDVYVYEAM
ncbi:MAG TPA: methyltransferase domain-containing protein [Candidatus Binataceae bacterium]|nr:methyltransferase domain-containing protein [Candidatus Binataceae bacterium]